MVSRLILAIAFCAIPFQLAARDLLVFAAASLKEPLDAIAADFGDVVVTYGGSGTLARQVTLGAPADVVILAHPRWIDHLDDSGQIGDRRRIAGNSLVVVAPEAQALSFGSDDWAARLGAGRLAIGFVQSVPAGIYGKAGLETLGLWNAVSDQLAPVENVRAALSLVARAQVPLGIVYATDARVSDNVHIVATFPSSSHPQISYVAATVAESDHPQAIAFLRALTSARAQERLSDAGFLPVVDVQ